MIRIVYTLSDKLSTPNNFAIGVELVTTRGTMADAQAIRARSFSSQLVHCNLVDWVSITDNAGGNPQLSPMALGKPILYAGKEVVIHLSCKDFNRNGLESEAWQLSSEGFHNILALERRLPGNRLSRSRQAGVRHRFDRITDDARRDEPRMGSSERGTRWSRSADASDDLLRRRRRHEFQTT